MVNTGGFLRWLGSSMVEHVAVNRVTEDRYFPEPAFVDLCITVEQSLYGHS